MFDTVVPYGDFLASKIVSHMVLEQLVIYEFLHQLFFSSNVLRHCDSFIAVVLYYKVCILYRVFILLSEGAMVLEKIKIKQISLDTSTYIGYKSLKLYNVFEGTSFSSIRVTFYQFILKFFCITKWVFIHKHVQISER